MLSLQASYAAPLILLAQNRQEQRDKVIAEQDRQANARAHADMEFLAREVASLRMAVGEVATRDFLRSELRSLLAEIDEQRPPTARPRRTSEATRATRCLLDSLGARARTRLDRRRRPGVAPRLALVDRSTVWRRVRCRRQRRAGRPAPPERRPAARRPTDP